MLARRCGSTTQGQGCAGRTESVVQQGLVEQTRALGFVGGRNQMDRTTAEVMLLEARKKSGWLAAFLNLVLPGAGYAYCGRWFLGIVAFFLVIAIWVVSFGLAGGAISALVFIDGFLAAGRYNRKLTEKILAEQLAASSRNDNDSAPARDERTCPHCAERILAKASKCRFCGESVAPTLT